MTRVIVLSGGASTEHEVSLASGADVVEALERVYPVTSVIIEPSGAWRVGDRTYANFGPVLDALEETDVVFPVLHGGWGEDGGLQRELEVRGIRFVGSSSRASRIGMSKRQTADAAAALGVSTISTLIVERERYLADPDLVAHALLRGLTLPRIVKPDTGGSSVGVSVVRSRGGLRPALEEAFALDRVALLQPLLTGAEVSVGVWHDAAGALQVTGGSLLHLPEDDGSFFTYEHKYEGAGGWLEIPAAFPDPVLAALRRSALRTAEALGVDGLARVDFFVEEDGVVLNEVNTMPGLRRSSHFPRLVDAAGTGYDELLRILVDRAAG